MCPSISVFGLFNVYLYGGFIAIGLAACFLVLFTYSKRFGISSKFTDFVFYNGFAAIILGFGGANLFQAIYDVIDNPEAGFDFMNAGMTFMGGLIFGLLHYDNDQDALEFATAASCLKHTIKGDFNWVTIQEVENLMNGDASGRVKR